MLKKIFWLSSLICLLSLLPATAQKPAAPQEQTPTVSATETLVPPTAPLKIHPWWDLTEETVRKYFNMGVAETRNDDIKSNFPIKTLAYYGYPKSTQIDALTSLLTITLFTPPRDIYGEGAAAEKKMLSSSQMEEKIQSLLSSPMGEQIVVMATTQNKGLINLIKPADFALETDSGERTAPISGAEPYNQMGTSDSSYGITTGDRSDMFRLVFPTYNEKHEPIVTQQTKWVRVWIIAPGKRLPVTFWLDGSNKVEVGEAR